MSSLAELLQQKKKNLTTNQEGIIVRTKEGELYREKIVDGQIVRDQLVAKKEFVPIEAAPDPEVIR